MTNLPPLSAPRSASAVFTSAAVAVNECTRCGRPADAQAPAVLASGLDHPLCAHAAWSTALVASAQPLDVDGLAVGLLRARQQIRALTRA